MIGWLNIQLNGKSNRIERDKGLVIQNILKGSFKIYVIVYMIYISYNKLMKPWHIYAHGIMKITNTAHIKWQCSQHESFFAVYHMLHSHI